jgi:hypothetical protein
VAGSLSLYQPRHSKYGAYLSQLEVQALTALHAFPLLHCPNSPVAAGTPSALLHDICREEIMARLAAMPFLKRKLVIVAWPPAMVLWGLGLTLANGAYVARRYGRGRIGQFADQMRLAFTQGIPVNSSTPTSCMSGATGHGPGIMSCVATSRAAASSTNASIATIRRAGPAPSF